MASFIVYTQVAQNTSSYKLLRTHKLITEYLKLILIKDALVSFLAIFTPRRLPTIPKSQQCIFCFQLKSSKNAVSEVHYHCEIGTKNSNVQNDQ